MLRLLDIQLISKKIFRADRLNEKGATKQLCNRLLEPFMWTTMLITGSREGWDNFFNLRCPQYETSTGRVYKSKKDWWKHNPPNLSTNLGNDLGWLKINKGQAEIHMMALAEAIYDAVNESTPKQLKAGEWHIPFRDKIIYGLVGDISHNRKDDNHIQKLTVKISTAIAERTSYTVVGEEEILKSSEEWQKLYPEIKVLDPDGWDRSNLKHSWYEEQISFEEYSKRLMISTYQGINNFPLQDKHSIKKIDYAKMIDLHDRLISQDPLYSSPLEHCARAMNEREYKTAVVKCISGLGESELPEYSLGWCNNLKGFISYRYMIDNNLREIK